MAPSLDEERTIQREFGILLRIKDQYPKAMICLQEFQGETYEGIPCIALREFLSTTKL